MFREKNKIIVVFADLRSSLMQQRIEALNKHNLKVILVHNADGQKLEKEICEKYKDYEIIENNLISIKFMRYVFCSIYTFYLLLKYNPKLIIIHWASRLYQALAFYPFRERIIVSTMGSDINKEVEAKGLKFFFTNVLLKNARCITTKSQYMKETLLKNFKQVNKDKIAIISWGVDDRFFNKCDVTFLLEKHRIREDFSKIFLSIRRMTPLYHNVEILETFIKYKKEINPSAVLLMSTNGINSKNDKYYKKIKRIIKDNIEIERDIILIDIPHDIMHLYIFLVDVIISYSLTDGLSQSLMEAVAAEKTCITYNNFNHKEVIIEGFNGFYFHNEKELYEALNKDIKTDLKIKNYELLSKKIQEKNYYNLCEKILKESNP